MFTKGPSSKSKVKRINQVEMCCTHTRTHTTSHLCDPLAQVIKSFRDNGADPFDAGTPANYRKLFTRTFGWKHIPALAKTKHF